MKFVNTVEVWGADQRHSYTELPDSKFPEVEWVSFKRVVEKKRGRPRKDDVRKQVLALRAKKWSWPRITKHLNDKRGVSNVESAYRNLVKKAKR